MVTFKRAVELYTLKTMGAKLSPKEKQELEEYEEREERRYRNDNRRAT